MHGFTTPWLSQHDEASPNLRVHRTRYSHAGDAIARAALCGYGFRDTIAKQGNDWTLQHAGIFYIH